MSGTSMLSEPTSVSARFAPVFVVGCPRSGTTMLAGLLNESPWGGAFETQFIPVLAEVGAVRGPLGTL